MIKIQPDIYVLVLSTESTNFEHLDLRFFIFYSSRIQQFRVCYCLMIEKQRFSGSKVIQVSKET